jgi:hypothetical protein
MAYSLKFHYKVMIYIFWTIVIGAYSSELRSFCLPVLVGAYSAELRKGCAVQPSSGQPAPKQEQKLLCSCRERKKEASYLS